MYYVPGTTVLHTCLFRKNADKKQKLKVYTHNYLIVCYIFCARTYAVHHNTSVFFIGYRAVGGQHDELWPTWQPAIN